MLGAMCRFGVRNQKLGIENFFWGGYFFVKTWMVGECKFGILQEMSLQILYMKYVK
jgi:hypothetical protein